MKEVELWSWWFFFLLQKWRRRPTVVVFPFFFQKKCLSPPFHVLIRVYVNVGCFYMVFLFFPFKSKWSNFKSLPMLLCPCAHVLVFCLCPLRVVGSDCYGLGSKIRLKNGSFEPEYYSLPGTENENMNYLINPT